METDIKYIRLNRIDTSPITAPDYIDFLITDARTMAFDIHKQLGNLLYAVEDNDIEYEFNLITYYGINLHLFKSSNIMEFNIFNMQADNIEFYESKHEYKITLNDMIAILMLTGNKSKTYLNGNYGDYDISYKDNIENILFIMRQSRQRR